MISILAGRKRNRRRAGAIAALAQLCWLAAAAAQGVTIRPIVPAEDWLLLPEPKFMRPEVAAPIPGSERTLMAAAYLHGGEVKLMSRREFEALEVSWPEFRQRAAGNIMLRFEATRPEMIRDSDGSLQCMLYRGDDRAIAALLFAPGLRERFEPFFGPEQLVIVPRRSMLFVFPKLASRFEEFATDVLMAYNNAAYPVSREVFEVNDNGLRAVGIFEQ